MREIKFRAWVEIPGTDKKYFYYFKIGEFVPANLSVVSWQEYTGLKDKNGKEIYNGDIVSQYSGKEYQNISTVIWISDEFRSGWYLDKPVLDLGQERVKTLEVIGNIYENADLLNA